MAKKKSNTSSAKKGLKKNQKRKASAPKKKSTVKKATVKKKTKNASIQTTPTLKARKYTDDAVSKPLNNIIQNNTKAETSPHSQNSSTQESHITTPTTNVQNTEQHTPRKRGRKKKREPKSWEEKAQALPTFEVSNYPKLPVKKILITQNKPTDLQNPYQFLIDKYKVDIEFRPFIKAQGLSAQEFRNQKVNILEYGGVIFTSKFAMDCFFKIVHEMRMPLPDTFKYFCLNEQIANYIQKYMELRKRRVFWGQGTLADLKNTLKKNIDKKLLLPASDVIKDKIIGVLDELNAKYTLVDVYKTVPENISDIRPEKFDIIVFFTPIAVESLKKYFPTFKQNKTRFAAYSILTAKKLQELGYRVDIYAPTKEFPSMVNALAHYLLHAND